MSLNFNLAFGGSNGGSGGQKIQYSTMPDVMNGAIIQYTGETTQQYTKGYFYRGASFEAQASATVSVGTDLSNLMVDADTFGTKMEELIGEPLESTAYMFQYLAGEWLYNGDTNLDGTIQDYGITFDEPVDIIDMYTSYESINAFMSDEELFKSMIQSTGNYEFIYDGGVGSWMFDGQEVYLGDYGISYDTIIKPELSVNQTVGSGLQIDIFDDIQFYGEAVTLSGSDEAAIGDYTFTYEADGWRLQEAGEIVELSNWGISVTGNPQIDDTFVVTLDGLEDSPVDGEVIHVDYMAGLEEGTEITVGYEPALSAWLQINVQPTPEIATQETVEGNTELSADIGVLVVETPDGSEDKQVANVEYINNIVGNVETLLSEV